MLWRALRLAPEGAWIIGGSLLLALLAVIAALMLRKPIYSVAAVSALVWLVLVLQFFRDPERESPVGDRIILSPADGKIIAVGETDASPLGAGALRLSIFMSPVNVHVNRAPYSGSVASVKHISGKFLSAFKPEAERENERTIIHLDTEHGKMAFSQVAGFLARRIVFHPKPGDTVRAGDRVGMIRFGSRVDLFVPKNVKFNVSAGDRVTAGSTILGEFIDD